MVDGSMPILAPSSISADQFRAILTYRNSPATAESATIYSNFVGVGIDPEIALGHFAAESNYGKAGYATVTLNWGNILYYTWIENNCPANVEPYKPNSYTYSKFTSWSVSVTCAYAPLMVSYDRQGYDTLYKMSAHWLGATPGSARHLTYMNNIIYHINQNREFLGIEEMANYTVYRAPKKVTVPTGTWIYDNEACAPSANNIKIDPGRDMPLVGVLDNGNWVVGYVPSSNPPDLLKVYYVKPTLVSSSACPPANNCDDEIDQATAPLYEQIASLEEEVETLDNEVSELNSQVVELEESVNNLESDNNALSEENDELSSQVNTLTIEIVDLQETNAEYLADLEIVGKAETVAEKYRP